MEWFPGTTDDLAAQAHAAIQEAVGRGMPQLPPASPNALVLTNQVISIHARAADAGMDEYRALSDIIDEATEWAPPGQRKRTWTVRAAESVTNTVADVAKDVGQGVSNAAEAQDLKPSVPTWVKVTAAGAGVVVVVALAAELRAWAQLLGKGK